MSDTTKEKLNQMLDQDQEPDVGATSPDPTPKVFPKSHPAGLWVLFTTEMWERFCYYGMRAFLVLYIYTTATQDGNPGFGWTKSEAYQLYGYFTGLVYLTPLLCGWIADYFIGQHRSMVLGGILIAMGEFTLCATEFIRSETAGIPVTYASDPFALITFYSGLLLIIIGTGFFKPCVSVMVGQLYGEGDPRRDGGFTIFYMGINLGAMLSPFVAGTIAEKIGWEWGFFTAGVGMVFGLITYSLFRPKYLSHLGLPPHKSIAIQEDTGGNLSDADTIRKREEAAAKAEKDKYERTRPLTSVDLDKVFVIIALTLFSIAFWLSFEQAGSSLNVFAKDSTNRKIDFYESTPGFVRNILLENEFIYDLDDAIKPFVTIQNDTATILKTRKIEDKKRIKPFEKIQRFMATKEAQEKTVDTLVGELKEKSKAFSPTLTIPLDKEGAYKICLVKKENENAVPASTDTVKVFPLVFEEGKLCDKSQQDLNNALDQAKNELSAAEKEDLLELLGKFPGLNKGLDDALAKADKIYKPGISLGTFPATWYQSANAMGIVIFAPVFSFIWIFLAARKLEPSTPVKFGIGLLLVSLSFVVMVPGAVEAKNTLGLAAPYWLILSYLLATWGELCLSPVGLSMVSKLAPVRFASLLMGFWFISSAIALWTGGSLAALFGTESGAHIAIKVFGEKGGMADFFLLMAIIPAVAGLIVLLSSSKLKKMMHGAG